MLRWKSSLKPAASGDWSPLDLPGLLLWVDPSDESTITESSGRVSQIDDKSGNGNHITASSADRPTTGTRTINSLNVLDYSGTNVMSRTDAMGLTGNPDLYFFNIWNSDDVTTNADIMNIGSSTVAAGQTIRVRAGDTSYRFSNGNQVFKTTSNNTDYSGLWQRASGDTYGDGLCWVDGVSETETGSANPTGTPNVVDQITTLGAETLTTNNEFDGKLGEQIIGNAVLSASDRANLFAYSLAKWGK